MRNAFRIETNFWILDFIFSLVIGGGDFWSVVTSSNVVVVEEVTTGSIVIPRLRRTIRSNCASRSKRSLEFSVPVLVRVFWSVPIKVTINTTHVHSAIIGDCVGAVENEEGDAASGMVEARRSVSKDEDRRLGDDSTDNEE